MARKKFDPEFHLRTAGRLGRLKAGFPLSTGETPAKMPATSILIGKRPAATPMPMPMAKPPGASQEALHMRERQRTEQSQGMERGMKKMMGKKKKY